MLKGDLVTTPLPAVLRQLADGVASGCLHVLDGIGEAAKVFVRGGQVYAVQVPGRRPQLGARLVSSGSLGPEALAEALEAQRTELQGWRLGELLVHLGYVDQPVVEAFINEQVREQTSDLMRWPTGTWKFRVNERTREDVAPPTPVEDLLAEVADRMAEWATITETVHGPDAVPVLSASGQSDSEMSIDPDAWSLLCKVDGTRSIAELARECGFTLYEAGQVVYSLVRSGLLEVEELLVGAETVPAGGGGSVSSRLAAAFAPSEPEIMIPHQAEEPTPAEVANLISAALREDRTVHEPAPQPEVDVDVSIDRVSAALNSLLGPSTTDESLFAAPKPRTRKATPKPLTPAEQDRAAKASARAEREAKRRSRDSEELAQAQAELEAERAADAAAADAAADAAHGSDHEAEIVSLAQVRRDVARRDEEEAARLAAEVEALATAAAQAAADQAARLAAAQAAADEAAAQAQAQALADEERARLEAEAAAQAQAEAEAEAAAQAAADEAARLAAEQAAADEAARLAAEQAAADEAARLAAEQAAADAHAAAQAKADEAAARQAAEREAAEQAEVAAAQVAYDIGERARIEEERRAASEEQAAAAAEAEALAAEQAAADAHAAVQAKADVEDEENSRLAAQRAGASDAFAELSATAASSSDVLVQAEEDPTEVEEILEPAYKEPDTDMASLFRELSSLGMDDEPAPAPARPAPNPARPPAAAPAASKKKKGLFGR